MLEVWDTGIPISNTIGLLIVGSNPGLRHHLFSVSTECSTSITCANSDFPPTSIGHTVIKLKGCSKWRQIHSHTSLTLFWLYFELRPFANHGSADSNFKLFSSFVMNFSILTIAVDLHILYN